MSNPEEALFDSWQQGRKQGMSAGIRYEQERIIKLLETEIERFEHEDFYAVGVTNGLIKLIKGKTNG